MMRCCYGSKEYYQVSFSWKYSRIPYGVNGTAILRSRLQILQQRERQLHFFPSARNLGIVLPPLQCRKRWRSICSSVDHPPLKREPPRNEIRLPREIHKHDSIDNRLLYCSIDNVLPLQAKKGCGKLTGYFQSRSLLPPLCVQPNPPHIQTHLPSFSKKKWLKLHPDPVAPATEIWH